MEVIVIDTRHSLLEIPAFYTIIPGAHFRERAMGSNVGLFSAKLLAENRPPGEALQRLLKIERLLPQKYYIKFYIGSCYRSLGQLETALSYYQQALALDPLPQDLVSIYSYMGLCLKDRGEYRKALKVLKEGEKIDTERTDIHNLMGFCHFKLKEYESAIASFKKVIRLNPASAIDYANIASNYRDMGDPQKAIRYYELALAIDPSIEFAKENLAKMQPQT
jgi:ribosomal protein S12 methylthiotransferase accessory factor